NCGALLLHQCQCLQGMHDPGRWRDGLCLHRAAGTARDDTRTVAEQETDPRPRHRDRTAQRAVQITVSNRAVCALWAPACLLLPRLCKLSRETIWRVSF